ncbi:MAG: glycosyltransferase family 2 protein [Lachnospiraceae bacterium]|nr:glycosyltransferase family 2 protein [Lachnospiraceae bacterium]
MRDLISITVPCFNEEEALPIFFEELEKERQKLPCDSEVILVDDGSKDRTPIVMQELAAKYLGVRFLILSRNFGKEGAMAAGLSEAKGDYAVVMDADLQHPPCYIGVMYDAIKNPENGKSIDSAAMYRTGRKGEKRIRSFFAKRMMKRFGKISGIDIPPGATDYRMVSRKMLDAYLKLGESNRFSKGLFDWIGFDTKWIPYENVERVAGKTKWSFMGLAGYGLEAMLSFSDKPLKYAAVLGGISCTLAVIFAIYVIIKTLIWGDPVAGFPSLFCMILFLGGSILLFLGLIGRYVSKIYMETKRRPLFVVKESGGGKKED